MCVPDTHSLRVRTKAVGGRHSRLGKLVPGNGFNLLLWKRIFLKISAVRRSKVRISNLQEVWQVQGLFSTIAQP